MYPSLRVSQFVGRNNLLKEIDDTFSGGNSSSELNVVVLLGMGGSGKTQLALEYCRQMRVSGRLMGIFWVDASTPSALERSFEAVAEMLSNGKREFEDTEANLSFVMNTLSRWTSPWLLVFDNFDRPSAFEDKNVRD